MTIGYAVIILAVAFICLALAGLDGDIRRSTTDAPPPRKDKNE